MGHSQKSQYPQKEQNTGWILLLVIIMQKRINGFRPIFKDFDRNIGCDVCGKNN